MSRPSLAETQALFWRAIAWPRGVEDFLRHASAAERARFDATFDETAAFSRTERLRVYAQAYFWRLFEVLEDQFPISAWLLGPRRFRNVVTDFVLEHPSSSPDIRRFGADFPDALASAERTHGLFPGVGAVAQVEHAIVAAVDQADEPRLRVADVQRIAPQQWPDTRFPVTHTARFVPCALPFAALRRAQAQGDPAPTSPPPAETGGPVLVWRQGDHDVYQRRLARAESRALQALSAGGTFSDACEAAAGPDKDGASAAEVAGWLQRWIQDDLLVR